MSIAELSHRGVIEIEGEDKATFLQGLISNDINLVTPEQAIYATLLTPQGRFLFDFFITEKNGAFLLDVEAARLDALLKKLSLFKLRSKVTLKARPDLKVYALWGERDFPKEAYLDPRLEALGARLMGKTIPNISAEEYDLHRLKLGVPEGGIDLFPEKAILLESGLDELHAISWTKGCYMGQELTARTKYRGLVRKRLFPVKIEGPTPENGAEVFLGGTPVGEMRSSRNGYGLALLRIEAVKGGEALQCGKTSLLPYIPDWMVVEEPS
ncbi:MAG: folate-binding protein [Alphaproteobacteria bacterium]|nr:folate-binding protein [Alphaproteobacteria bacterium]